MAVNTSAAAVLAAQNATGSARDVNQAFYMNPGCLIQISTVAVTTSAFSVTFSNVPAYNHLYIAIQARSTAAVQVAFVSATILNTTGTQPQVTQSQYMVGSASAASTAQTTGMLLGVVPGASATATSMSGIVWVAIPNWSQQSNTTMASGMSGAFYGTAAGSNIEICSTAGTYTFVGAVPQPSYALPNLIIQTNGNFAGTVAGGCTFTLYGSN